MLLMLMFIIMVWSNMSVLYNISYKWNSLLLTSLFSMMFFSCDNMINLILSWSGMGLFSSGMTSMKKANSSYSQMMMIWSTMSTFFLMLGFLFIGCNEVSELKNIDKLQSTLSTIILLMGMSVKSLMWPQSMWLFHAMKGMSSMSSLVHSLTVVFGGTYLIVFLFEEGWMMHKNIYMYSSLYIVSSTMNSWDLLKEKSSKSMLGCSTIQSINVTNSLLAFDTQLSIVYATLHGMSKSMLFMSFNTHSLYQMLCFLLLGGFPMTLNHLAKHNMNMFSSNEFMKWLSMIYIMIMLKFYEENLKSVNLLSANKSTLMKMSSTYWINMGSILGSMGSMQMGDPFMFTLSLILYKYIL